MQAAALAHVHEDWMQRLERAGYLEKMAELLTANAERFAEADPYVRAGLVTGWRVRVWTTVVGADAASPVGYQNPLVS